MDNNNEQKEYEELMSKFAKKVRETQDDFDRLSDNNKSKVRKECFEILKGQSIKEMIMQLTNR